MALGFGEEFVGGVGVACEDVVGRGDGFVGVDGTEADGLVEAVEDGGVGLCWGHVFCWVAVSCQWSPHPWTVEIYPSSSFPRVERSIRSTYSLIADFNSLVGRFRCSVMILPDTVTTLSRGGNL